MANDFYQRLSIRSKHREERENIEITENIMKQLSGGGPRDYLVLCAGSVRVQPLRMQVPRQLGTVWVSGFDGLPQWVQMIADFLGVVFG